ncbi:NifU family protein [Pelagibacteraceae bacterium]|nr:NifU family protein [Pelagibacteraceae bacterium]
MFIQTESTPNPNSLKFILEIEITKDQTYEFNSIDECANSELAAQLFSIEGVESIFFGLNFISINKNKYEWDQLKAPILTIIADFLSSEKQVIKTNDLKEINNNKTEFNPEDKEVVFQIQELLNSKIKPAVAQDGGDIEFKKFHDGIVYLALQGSCAGCPSSTMTLKTGIENLLKHYVREVKSVEQYV